MTEYIKRDLVMAAFKKACEECEDACTELDGLFPDCDNCLMNDVKKAMPGIPSVDVVTRDCYDQILFENDVMRHQLSDIGKSLGEKMDDVKPVKHGDWIIERDRKGRCTECGYKTDRTVTDYIPQAPRYCPNCGAEMR